MYPKDIYQLPLPVPMYIGKKRIFNRQKFRLAVIKKIK